MATKIKNYDVQCEAKTREKKRCKRKADVWRIVKTGDVIACCKQHHQKGYPHPYFL